MKIEAAHAASGEAVWHYFADKNAPRCPRGTKVQLLNRGFVACYGEYTDEVNFVAWAPCIKRDKKREKELGIGVKNEH